MSQELGLKGVMDLAFGYQRAQILFAANALGVFEALSRGPLPAGEVADHIGAEVRGVHELLEACVALGLLHRADCGYQNSGTARLFLIPGRAASFNPVLTFWQRFSYGTWGRLEQAVRDNRPQTATGAKPKDLFDELVEDPTQLRLFFDGLAGLAYWPAKKIADLVDFGTHRHLLDVGGGSGAFSAAIAERHPDLEVTLFDLEPVCALAQERFDRLDAGGRLRTVAGDFHNNELPEGVDCALVANVLHDWSPEECRALVEKVHRALTPGGKILVYEVMPSDVAETPHAALFSLTLVLDTERGCVYRFEEIAGWLAKAGFGAAERHPVTPGTELVVATKTE